MEQCILRDDAGSSVKMPITIQSAPINTINSLNTNPLVKLPIKISSVVLDGLFCFSFIPLFLLAHA
jgi:hypothetical protein